jgi:GAF domain-containing protein
MDLQRVFGMIAAAATRLCDARDAGIFQVEGNALRLVARHGPIPGDPLGKTTLPLTRRFYTGRAVLDRCTVQVADLQSETNDYPDSSDRARRLGFRTALAIPLVRSGETVGAISIRRTEAKLFSNQQIALLETFADQAIIAIENARLFEAEQESKRELRESLEYQTAMSEVLGVISRSPTDVQPVFEAIAQSAARLCAAQFCSVFRYDGKLIHFAAVHGASLEAIEGIKKQLPVVPSRGFAAARAILNNAIEQIDDILADSEYALKDTARTATFRSTVAVPIRRSGLPIGSIALMRSQIGKFPQRQIDLLETFADQAVIAIENTRLFEAEQARASELQDALAHQTATTEVLNVISRSPTEVAPVFDAIVKSSLKLCNGRFSALYQFDGELIHQVATHNFSPEALEATGRPIFRTPRSIRSDSPSRFGAQLGGEADCLCQCFEGVLPSESSQSRAPSPAHFPIVRSSC